MEQHLATSLAALLLLAVEILAAEYVEIARVRDPTLSLSADGNTVVGRSDSEKAFIWSREEGLRLLGTLPGHEDSFANDVSADGSVVVGTSDPGGSFVFPDEAFLWTEEDGMRGLGMPPGFNNATTAGAVSADGTVVVGAAYHHLPGGTSRDRHSEAFRWTEEDGWVSLGIPAGSTTSHGIDVSADGGTALVKGIGAGGDRQQLSLWDPQNGLQNLGPEPTTARGVPILHYRFGPEELSADGNAVS